MKFEFSEIQTSTVQVFRDGDWIYPGDVVVAEMQMVGREYFAGKLEVGMRFEVREGTRVTALGEILEICDKRLCRPLAGRPPDDASGG